MQEEARTEEHDFDFDATAAHLVFYPVYKCTIKGVHEDDLDVWDGPRVAAGKL